MSDQTTAPKKPHRITASKVPLAMSCDGAYFLPWEYRPMGEAAAYGHRVHRPLEFRQLGAAMPDILARSHPDVREGVPDLFADAPHLPPIPGLPTAEVTFAWDPTTAAARILGAGLERDYALFGPGEWGGTADVIGLRDGVPAVLDWKSGNPSYQPRDASNSWQLRFLGVALWLVLDRPADMWLGLHLTRNGRTNWSKDGLVDAPATAIQLGGWLEDMKELAARHAAIVAGGEPEYRKSTECRFCPARPKCPLFPTDPAGIFK